MLFGRNTSTELYQRAFDQFLVEVKFYFGEVQDYFISLSDTERTLALCLFILFIRLMLSDRLAERRVCPIIPLATSPVGGLPDGSVQTTRTTGIISFDPTAATPIGTLADSVRIHRRIVSLRAAPTVQAVPFDCKPSPKRNQPHLQENQKECSSDARNESQGR